MEKNIYKLKDGNGLQLICFPYLGGYANSFSNLVSHIDQDVEVWSFNPPGHGGSSAAPLENITSLVDLYYKVLTSVLKPPYVFFGHSMGAIVAYFLLQKICTENAPIEKPLAMILSAANTPAFFSNDNIVMMADDKVLERLNFYDGISENVLQEKSLIEYFIPVYRADFRVLKSASQLDYSALEISVYYLWGDQDNVVSINEVYNWSKYFVKTIHLIIIKNGTHMFVEKKAVEMAQKLDAILNDIAQFQKKVITSS